MSGHRLSVAVVDDDADVRAALARLVTSAGFEVSVHGDGDEFLRCAALQPPDCVVLDLHMPCMTGLQVLRALQAARRMLPIVVITAHDAPEAREQCLAAGAAAYLRKPLDEHVLLGTISAAVSAASHERR
jgi:FixJ family two-component response regulator